MIALRVDANNNDVQITLHAVLGHILPLPVLNLYRSGHVPGHVRLYGRI
jgi:hypothetical protein